MKPITVELSLGEIWAIKRISKLLIRGELKLQKGIFLPIEGNISPLITLTEKIATAMQERKSC